MFHLEKHSFSDGLSIGTCAQQEGWDVTSQLLGSSSTPCIAPSSSLGGRPKHVGQGASSLDAEDSIGNYTPVGRSGSSREDRRGIKRNPRLIEDKQCIGSACDRSGHNRDSAQCDNDEDGPNHDGSSLERGSSVSVLTTPWECGGGRERRNAQPKGQRQKGARSRRQKNVAIGKEDGHKFVTPLKRQYRADSRSDPEELQGLMEYGATVVPNGSPAGLVAETRQGRQREDAQGAIESIGVANEDVVGNCQESAKEENFERSTEFPRQTQIIPHSADTPHKV